MGQVERFIRMTGFAGLTLGQAAMIVIGGILLYLAIRKKYEPLLLIPIGFGIILGNMPLAGLMEGPSQGVVGGLLYYLFQGVWLAIFPPLVFLGIGALTDFGPLIANPVTLLLGAAAQLGVFTSYLGALAAGFTPAEAASIGIIGGADGPTSIFVTTKLAPHLLGPIAVAGYSYIALIPIIQPPVVKALTTPEERALTMAQMRKVSKLERILFPVVVTIVVGLLVPSSLTLIGMLMLGNLFRESGVVDRLAKTAESDIANITTIFLALTIGASASADKFFSPRFLAILALGLAAFVMSTAGGVLFGKLLCWLTKGKINPLIGAAGVSAVPAAARVSQVIGQQANPRSFLLMHAMGPNVAGVIGSAVAAGVFLALFG